MVMASLTLGRVLVSQMVCAPPPPMLKPMVSPPAVLLAAMMASRSEIPLSGPGSATRLVMLLVSPSAASSRVVTTKEAGEIQSDKAARKGSASTLPL